MPVTEAMGRLYRDLAHVTEFGPQFDVAAAAAKCAVAVCCYVCSHSAKLGSDSFWARGERLRLFSGVFTSDIVKQLETICRRTAPSDMPLNKPESFETPFQVAKMTGDIYQCLEEAAPQSPELALVLSTAFKPEIISEMGDRLAVALDLLVHREGRSYILRATRTMPSLT